MTTVKIESKNFQKGPGDVPPDPLYEPFDDEPFVPDMGGGLSPGAEARLAKKTKEVEKKVSVKKAEKTPKGSDDASDRASYVGAPKRTMVPTVIPRVPTVGEIQADALVLDPNEVSVPIFPYDEAVVPLDSIDINWAWNVRSGQWTRPGAAPIADEEDTTPGDDHFSSFCKDIAMRGLKTPLDVVRNDATGRLELVNGFRRGAALTRIYANALQVPGLESGMVDVHILHTDAKGARFSNIADNMNRDPLEASDIAWGVGELARLGYTESQIRVAVGKCQTYVNRLVRIQTMLPPSVTGAWRNGENLQGRGMARLSVEEMNEITRIPPGPRQIPEMEADYTRRLDEKTAGSRAESGEEKQWFQSAKKKACAIATLLGTLAQNDLIAVGDKRKGSDEDLDHWEVLLLHSGVKLGRKDMNVTARQRQAIAKAMCKAYVAARDVTEEEDEGLEEDE